MNGLNGIKMETKHKRLSTGFIVIVSDTEFLQTPHRNESAKVFPMTT